MVGSIVPVAGPVRAGSERSEIPDASALSEDCTNRSRWLLVFGARAITLFASFGSGAKAQGPSKTTNTFWVVRAACWAASGVSLVPLLAWLHPPVIRVARKTLASTTSELWEWRGFFISPRFSSRKFHGRP